MGEIRTRPLRDLCTFRHGGTPAKSNPSFWEGDVPWVSPKDMKQAVIDSATDYISAEAVENSATSIVPSGSILLVVRSGILAHSFPIAQVAKPVAFNQDIKAVTPTSADVIPDYLYWFLRSQSMNVVARGVKKGATVHSVQSGFIESLMVPVRPREEQRRIVDLLARAEGIVRLRREAQQKAAELIPAIFIDMFGDPATNPEAWPRQPLSTVAEVISGVAKGRKLEPGEAVELPYMRVANVKDGYLDLTEVKTIEIKRSEVEKLLIRPGDLLMTEGGDPDKLGRAALWVGEIEACVHQNHVFKVRSDRARLSPAYLRALAGSVYGKAYFLSVAKKTTGIASINKTQLSAFPVPLPPLPLQQAFERRVQAVESIVSQQIDATGKAKASFDALLSRAFGG
jgi:type I restriction enzyme, S subunit